MIHPPRTASRKAVLKTIGYLNRTGMADGNAGRYQEAKSKLRRALEKIQNIGLDCLEPKILNNLGLVYAMEGRWDRALLYYNDALSMTEFQSGNETTLYRTVQKNITTLFERPIRGV